MIAPTIFGGNTGLTYEQVQRRRSIADSLMRGAGASRNVGEGIGNAGKRIAAALMTRRADKADEANRAEAQSAFRSALGGLGGGYTPSVSSRSPGAAPAASGDFDPIINSLFNVESSSSLDAPNWGIRGPRVPTGRYAGERAIGPAQIMPGNIPEWSQRHLGRRLDPDQLAAGLAAGDPAAQDAYMQIVRGQIGAYAAQGYSPEEIAVAWHSGPRGVERMRQGQGAPRDTATGIATFGEGDTYLSRFSRNMPQGDLSNSGITDRNMPQGELQVAPGMERNMGQAQVAGRQGNDTLTPQDVIRMNANGTRRLPLSGELTSAVTNALAPLGLSFDVFSAGQAPRGSGGPRTGSTRHDHGNAADGFFYQGDRRLNPDNPQDRALIAQAIGALRQNGITGIGHGPGYMMPGSFHIGFGNEAVWGDGGASANAVDWVREAFYGAQPGQAPTATMSTQNVDFTPGGGDMGGLLELLGNPYLTSGEQAVVQMLLQQRMQGMVPPAPITGRDRYMNVDGVLYDITGDRPVAMTDPQAEPGFRMLTADEVAQRGLPEGAYQEGPDGRVYPIGTQSTNITVNTGPTGIDYGDPPKDHVWQRNQDGSIVLDDRGAPVPIPIGPAFTEQQQAEERQQERQRVERLKLGGTLELINLNLAELEDGGMPVAGRGGDFARTTIGRMILGNDATDFQNRTAAITDQAAFNEIQTMRDNSPTGGAVGQLTDAERQAIGNAVTALNSSTSPEEYARAARRYRELALDYAFGEGMWTLNDDGTVSLRGAGPAQPTAAPAFGGGNIVLSELEPAQIEAMDSGQLNALRPYLTDMTDAQLDAYIKANGGQ